MPKTFVPAAAEGVPLITQTHIDQSYELLAVLDVVAFAVEHLDQAGYAKTRIGDHIGVCLQLALRLASDQHDILVLAEVRLS